MDIGIDRHRLLTISVGERVDLDLDGVGGLTKVEVGQGDRGQAWIEFILESIARLLYECYLMVLFSALKLSDLLHTGPVLKRDAFKRRTNYLV